MATVIVIANYKGGVGKTTTTANLGVALATAPLNQRVLLVDGDPQSNLSKIFGCSDPNLIGERIEDILDYDGPRPTPPKPWSERPAIGTGQREPIPGGVHLLPSTRQLADVTVRRGLEDGFAYRLRDLVVSYGELYDYILIDTPPGPQSLVATFAMLAADYVIVPLTASDLDLDGAVDFAEVLEDEILPYNDKLRLLGVQLTMVDRRQRINNNYFAAIVNELGLPKIPGEIPAQGRVNRHPRLGVPSIVAEPFGLVGAAYARMAAAVHAGVSDEAQVVG